MTAPFKKLGVLIASATLSASLSGASPVSSLGASAALAQWTSVFPHASSYPLTAVAVLPSEWTTGATQTRASEKMINEILSGLPASIGAVIASGGLSSTSLSQTLQSATADLSTLLKSAENTFQAAGGKSVSLPLVDLYFLPKAAPKPSLLGTMGLPQLNLETVSFDPGQVKPRNSFLFSLKSGIQASLAADAVTPIGEKEPLPITPIAIHLHRAQAGASASGEDEIRLQILLRLNPMSKPFAKANDEVVLSSLELPNPSQIANTPVLLVTIEVSGNTTAVPQVLFEMGVFGGFDPSTGQYLIDMPLPLIADTTQGCSARALGTPKLVGVLGPRPSGNPVVNAILSGRPVQFHITSFEYDLTQKSIRHMEVRTSLPGLANCVSQQSVSDQIGAEAQEALNHLSENLVVEDTMKQALIDELYRM